MGKIREFYLMHGNIEVAELLINDLDGRVLRVEKIINGDHLPLDVKRIVEDADLFLQRLNRWWRNRFIPALRNGVEERVNMDQMNWPEQYIVKSRGFSLSDAYWIRKYDANTMYEVINFHQNAFSEEFGKFLMREGGSPWPYKSPDIATNGNLSKRWTVKGDGKRILLKGSTAPYHQEPINEVVASRMMDLLDFEHVCYDMDGEYSVCEAFTSEKMEYLPANQVGKFLKKTKEVSYYEHYIACCEWLGIENAREQIEKMLVIDYIIANSDRHYGNFGVVRNAETLSDYRIAPIFDNGNSLFYRFLNEQIPVFVRSVMARPFSYYHNEQLQLVKNIEWFDFGKKEELLEIMRSTLKNSQWKMTDTERPDLIVNAVSTRMDDLKQRFF